MSDPWATAPSQRLKKRRRTGRYVLLGLAITVVLAGAAGLAYAVGWGIADSDARPAALSSADVERQLECTSIKREMEAWTGGYARLADIHQEDREQARYDLKLLSDEGEAFLKAVTNYPDQPSKELAVAIAEYNVKIATLMLEATVSGKANNETQAEAAFSRTKVAIHYDAWQKATCS